MDSYADRFQRKFDVTRKIQRVSFDPGKLPNMSALINKTSTKNKREKTKTALLTNQTGFLFHFLVHYR